MSKVPFNKICKTCLENLKFHILDEEDVAYLVKSICNSCEKFGICNRCCRTCPDQRFHFPISSMSFTELIDIEPNYIDNNITYTVTYSDSTTQL